MLNFSDQIKNYNLNGTLRNRT